MKRYLVLALLIVTATVGISYGAITFTTGPDAPVGLSRPAGAYYNGEFFVVGGEMSGDAFNDAVSIYNIAGNSWTTAAGTMPTGASNICAAQYNGKIYIPGGFNGSGLDSLQIYDIATDAWTTGANLPSTLFASSCAAYNGKVYTAGGDDGALDDALYIYDIATDAWSAGASLPAGVRYACATFLDGKLYVAGGIGDLNDVYEYDPGTDTWATFDSLNTGRGGCGMGVANGSLYVYGGVWSSYSQNLESNSMADAPWFDEGSALTTGRRTFAYASGDGYMFAGCGWAGAYLTSFEYVDLGDDDDDDDDDDCTPENYI